MLKFLTHKLKVHSINDDEPQRKADEEDHDSGTESDDEHSLPDEPEISMESCSVVTATSRSSLATPASPFLDSALPSDCDQSYDQHSSEEELEVINSHRPKNPLITSSTGQEKRKWSQVTPENDPEKRHDSPFSTPPPPAASLLPKIRTESATSSSEEEAAPGSRAAAAAPAASSRATPVRFRSSPPTGIPRPLQVPHFQEPSPRKRHRNAAHPRPCLDFEKMQQLKARGWRHGSEPPVYCW